MSVPTSYLTSLKNLKNILQSIQGAQAPKKFTTRFLASLGCPSATDRLIIGVLKSLAFLNAEGAPTKRYYEYLDVTQAKKVLGDGIREAYADLYQINRKAQDLTPSEIKNKLKTLTQGQVSASVLDKMTGTFKALSANADFTITPSLDTSDLPTQKPLRISEKDGGEDGKQVNIGGLVYNIQIVLPADRDQAVYDVLFRSLKEHLLR